MARLTMGQRDRMPDSEFALPDHRFPVNDDVHAEKALQMGPRALHAGSINRSQLALIRAKARKTLGQRIGAKE